MYKEHFGLKEDPFSIAPDPRYLFLSEGHREALAHLEYGMRGGGGGFVLLTGEVGTGKTTVCRHLLEKIPDGAEVAFILNPKVTVEELLAAICDELGIGYPAGNQSVKIFVDGINEFLLDAHGKGRQTILLIEEAQNLVADVLEQLRLLTNLETNRAKLLQIIMIGQPELREMIARPELRQLSQRVTARYHLGPLTAGEVSAYVAHRLSVAGGPAGLFPPPAIKKIFRMTGGVPRLINVLCDRALLGAYVEGKKSVDLATLRRAAREVFGGAAQKAPSPRRYAAGIAALLLIALGTALGAYYDLHRGEGNPFPPPAVKERVAAPLPARPGLDTLWWLDDRSLPGRSLVSRDKEKAAPARWSVADRFGKKTLGDKVPQQQGAGDATPLNTPPTAGPGE